MLATGKYLASKSQGRSEVLFDSTKLPQASVSLTATL
jgi:hypothetical protein